MRQAHMFRAPAKGSSADDHAGGSDAGVAFGSDPSGGEPAYQFGNLWDP